MNRREINNRVKNIAVQILETIRFISFRDDSFTKGQPPISVTGHWRILSNAKSIRPWCKVIIKKITTSIIHDNWLDQLDL